MAVMHENRKRGIQITLENNVNIKKPFETRENATTGEFSREITMLTRKHLFFLLCQLKKKKIFLFGVSDALSKSDIKTRA